MTRHSVWKTGALGISFVLSAMALAVAADKLNEKFQKRIDTADAAYQIEVQKAENACRRRTRIA